jgi:ankyrin repeat protein
VASGRETLRALVDAGANVNIADSSGSTPLQLARNRGYREMVAILEKSGRSDRRASEATGGKSFLVDDYVH